MLAAAIQNAHNTFQRVCQDFHNEHTAALVFHAIDNETFNTYLIYKYEIERLFDLFMERVAIYNADQTIANFNTLQMSTSLPATLLDSEEFRKKVEAIMAHVIGVIEQTRNTHSTWEENLDALGLRRGTPIADWKQHIIHIIMSGGKGAHFPIVFKYAHAGFIPTNDLATFMADLGLSYDTNGMLYLDMKLSPMEGPLVDLRRILNNMREESMAAFTRSLLQQLSRVPIALFPSFATGDPTKYNVVFEKLAGVGIGHRQTTQGVICYWL